MYAVLPKGAKPSKAISKDKTRGHLLGAELVCTHEGDNTVDSPPAYELQVTDSYKLARVPLFVTELGTEPLEPGPIDEVALKAIEKTGAFRANGTVIPVDKSGVQAGPEYPRPPRAGRWPNMDQLVPDTKPDGRIVIRFNAEFLWQTAQALGCGARAGQAVEIEINQEQLRENGDVSETLRPIVVRNPNEEGIGLLMPIRRS